MAIEDTFRIDDANSNAEELWIDLPGRATVKIGLEEVGISVSVLRAVGEMDEVAATSVSYDTLYGGEDDTHGQGEQATGANTPEAFDRLIIDSFGMFTDAGNRLVGEAIAKVANMPLVTTDAELTHALTAQLNEIAKTHPEVWDTAVRDVIVSRIARRTGRTLSIHF
ncbi:hypothetical protein CKO28_01350 [Rhodovibrio sodomensis]|uniref:Uncharacterized protein n=1 Tax=Rhodovibrio sodomensis TaxID=1088 RepID=A0ABS1D8J6_9PROT|nr:hypothetical protein [Rhodovibrio sodomensis]MBK1666690.1 hypothetical protein [Rhodovibrio sodomensis]